MQPITDYSKFFNEAKDALNRLDALSARLESEQSREAALKRAMESEQKKRDDKIASTIKKRSDELSAVYDKESAGVLEKIRNVKARREKTKAVGVQERILLETAEMQAENKTIRQQMKEGLRRSGAPGFCASGLYNTLFMPRRIGEFLLLLVLFLLFFVLLPPALYLLIPERRYLYLVPIYVASILVFGGIYLLVNNLTKFKHSAVLKENRQLLDRYYANNKKMKKVARSIKKDENEDRYDLGSFDGELLNLERELAGLGQQKKEALESFEGSTKPAIIGDIQQDFNPRIAEMKKEHEEALMALRMTESQKKNLVLFIGDEYESYLGREYLNVETLDTLQSIMETEQLRTLSEAKARYKSRNA